MRGMNNTRLKNILKEPLAYGLNVSSEFDDHNMPRYIRITDFDDFNNLNDQTFKSLPIEIAQSALLKDGDLLFARSGASVGKTYLYKQLPNGACYAGYLIKARFNKHVVNPQYVYYFTKSQQYENWKNATYIQATIQNISAEKYYQLPIYLPSIKAQDRMVAYLDTKLSEIDHQVSLLTSKRDAYLRLKKSIINRAVTKGLNPDVQMKDSGVDWIGMIPEGWKVVHMKRALSFNNGRDYKNIEVDEGYPVIGSGGQFAYASEYLYDGEAILFGRKGTIDKPMHINDKFWTVDTMFYATPKSNAYGRYLYYQATAMPLNKYSTQTALPSMTQTSLQNILICFPPLSEQQAIAAYLDEKCSKIDTIVANLDKQISKYADLKRSLIDEVITGKRAV